MPQAKLAYLYVGQIENDPLPPFSGISFNLHNSFRANSTRSKDAARAQRLSSISVSNIEILKATKQSPKMSRTLKSKREAENLSMSHVLRLKPFNTKPKGDSTMSQVSFIKSSAMKNIICASIFALALLLGILSSPMTAKAQTYADGSFRYTLEDGLTKAIEFSARDNGDGTASGRITFSGPAEFPEQDLDGTGDADFSGRLEDLQITAEIDGMAVERNRAVMSGTVTGSTLSQYIGQRVLLVVEDNGDGIARGGDTFSLGLYKPQEITWIPSDADLREDNGWSLTWIATDADRRDDEGIQITRHWVRNCQSFPLSSYDFVDVTEGEGNIQVQP